MNIESFDFFMKTFIPPANFTQLFFFLFIFSLSLSVCCTVLWLPNALVSCVSSQPFASIFLFPHFSFVCNELGLYCRYSFHQVARIEKFSFVFFSFSSSQKKSSLFWAQISVWFNSAYCACFKKTAEKKWKRKAKWRMIGACSAVYLFPDE